MKRKATANEETTGRKRRMTDNSGLRTKAKKHEVTNSPLRKNEVDSDDEDLGVESIDANAILAELGMSESRPLCEIAWT